MPKITFYPLGNADSTLIDLRNGEKLLFDYANRRDADDKNDKRIDLPAELRKDLGTRDYYDVVAFTHLDQDHYDGTSEFFYLDHDKAYQGKVDGKSRIKINIMWVPAAVITEELDEEWDVFKIPHHCSYTAIGPDKGDDKTEPSDNIDWLYRDQGQCGGILVSTSKPIPKKGTDEDKDVQPPHREAANFYRDIAQEKSGDFLVTMEEPSVSQPKPIIVEVDQFQATVKKSQIFGPAAAASVSAPRAG